MVNAYNSSTCKHIDTLVVLRSRLYLDADLNAPFVGKMILQSLAKQDVPFVLLVESDLKLIP